MRFPKIENLYARDDATHRLVLGELRRSDFGQIGSWLVTEKIDGTNIRLVYRAARATAGLWAPGLFEVRGRSDEATLPKRFQEEALPDVDLRDRMAAALSAIDDRGVAEAMVVYGEGYGPGIQKGGGDYGPRKAFRVFDVVTYTISEDGDFSRGLWRTWEDVESVASILGVQTAPMLGGIKTIADALDFVRSDPYSRVAVEDKGVVEYEQVADLRVMEGVVARTDPYLFDFRGNRVIFKLKSEDLP